MQKLKDLIAQPTTKAGILLLVLFLVFVWYRGSVSESSVSEVLAEDQGSNVIIPKIGVTAPIVYAHSNDPDAIASLLREGVVHLSNTPTPGNTGNVYLVGYSASYPGSSGEYRGVFNRLPELQVDDDILVTSDTSESLVYKVIDIKVVNSSGITSTKDATDKRRLLTLETSYPSGNSESHYLVIAELK